jgi:hypothetical protein
MTELLRLPLRCSLLSRESASLAVIGDQSLKLAERLAADGRLMHDVAEIDVHFGLPYFTAPTPLLMRAITTEKGTMFSSLALFGWIEDNYIYEPRAEVFGQTLFGEEPIMFLRDFDWDRPIEAWFNAPGSGAWARIAGVVIASSRASAGTQHVRGDDGALAALEQIFPGSAQPFIDDLALDFARGGKLKALLRARRKTTDAVIMALCDGWRVLMHALPAVRVNADAGELEQITELLGPPTMPPMTSNG